MSIAWAVFANSRLVFSSDVWTSVISLEVGLSLLDVSSRILSWSSCFTALVFIELNFSYTVES